MQLGPRRDFPRRLDRSWLTPEIHLKLGMGLAKVDAMEMDGEQIIL